MFTPRCTPRHFRCLPAQNGPPLPVVIALADNPELSSEEERTSEDGQKAGQTAGNPRVLIVEDNPEIRTMMSLTLRSEFDVGTAGSFDQAMEATEGHTYDVLLVDIDLGGDRSGVDLLRRLRAEGHRDIPMIACTAYALPGDRERFLQHGFDDYIGKPFTRKQLIAVLRRAL
jgi:CheY-like chemotaxis protein